MVLHILMLIFLDIKQEDKDFGPSSSRNTDNLLLIASCKWCWLPYTERRNWYINCPNCFLWTFSNIYIKHPPLGTGTCDELLTYHFSPDFLHLNSIRTPHYCEHLQSYTPNMNSNCSACGWRLHTRNTELQIRQYVLYVCTGYLIAHSIFTTWVLLFVS